MTPGQVDISQLNVSAKEEEAAGLLDLSVKQEFEVPTPEPEKPQMSLEETESYRKLAQKEGSVDFFRDLRWAYSNLGNESLMPEDAPNGSAWYMLTYGRSARSEFMKQAMNYFMKQDKENEAQQALKDDHKKQMSFIRSLDVEVKRISVDMLRQVSDEELLKMVRERNLAP